VGLNVRRRRIKIVRDSIFLSHTRKDKEFCDRFDNACATIGIRRFRSEFESLGTPAWARIKAEMNQSIALFLLVGKELVEAQRQQDDNWKYTQNWIAYEIGLACASKIDVWVICDGVNINFPVPYLNNYEVHGFHLEHADNREWFYRVLKGYKIKKRYLPRDNIKFYVTCPHETCGSVFNLHSILERESTITCPTCLRPMVFNEGWLLNARI